MYKISLIVFLVCSLSFAQSFQDAYNSTRELPITEINGVELGGYNQLTGNPNEWSKVIGVLYEFDDIRFAKVQTDGTFLLYDDWNQNGTIKVGNRKYIVPNANFHVGRDELMSKTENDSIFLFDLYSLDEFSLGNKRFKHIQDNRDGAFKVFEIVYDSQNVSLLKRHTAEMIEADPNPMLNRLRNKIVKKESYYIQKNGALSDFSLKKSSYVDLIEKNQKKEFMSLVRDRNLSFNNEDAAAAIISLISELNNPAK